MDGTGGWDRVFFFKLELLQIVGRSGGVRLSILALVLALLCYSHELLDLGRGNRGIADKLVDVTSITAQILPSEDFIAVLPDFDSEVEGFVEQESLLVSLGSKSVDFGVVTLFFSEKLSLAFLKNALDDELVLEVLVGAADADRRVFEDELGVALGRKRSYEVELALGEFNQCFLGA